MYQKLTPTEESPALYSESAQIVSAVMTAMLTAMSSASVYSQDSWKTESPFVPVVKVDPRRMAIAFSPSLQWSDMAEGPSDKKLRVESPSVHPTLIPQPEVSFSEAKEDNDTKIHNVVPLVASDAVGKSVRGLLDVGSPVLVKKRHTKLLKSRNIDEQGAKRPKSAFHKVMVLFQPSKREPTQVGKANGVTIPKDLWSMEFNLPDFRVSPVLYSFIDHTSTHPLSSRMSITPSSMAPSPDTLVEDGGQGVRRLPATVPPVLSLEVKDRRRYRSSPAVPYFPRWDKDNMPPLPPMPVHPLNLTLSKATTVASQNIQH